VHAQVRAILLQLVAFAAKYVDVLLSAGVVQGAAKHLHAAFTNPQVCRQQPRRT
jgi:hypothetical protein